MEIKVLPQIIIPCKHKVLFWGLIIQNCTDKSYMCLVETIHHTLRAVLHLKTLFECKYWTSDIVLRKASGNRVQCFS